jgi:hypothetical protein
VDIIPILDNYSHWLVNQGVILAEATVLKRPMLPARGELEQVVPNQSSSAPGQK